MSVEKLKKLLFLQRKFPMFFTGLILGLSIAVYLHCTQSIRTEYTSAYGNTILFAVDDVCKHNSNQLFFLTESSRKKRSGALFIDKTAYCGQERFTIEGEFQDTAINDKNDICSGIFYATVSKKDLYILFDLRYNKTDNCSQNDSIAGLTLYKQVSLLQDLIFKAKDIL